MFGMHNGSKQPRLEEALSYLTVEMLVMPTESGRPVPAIQDGLLHC
jgi:hypothetical protein